MLTTGVAGTRHTPLDVAIGMRAPNIMGREGGTRRGDCQFFGVMQQFVQRGQGTRVGDDLGGCRWAGPVGFKNDRMDGRAGD